METRNNFQLKSLDPRIDSPQIKVSYPSEQYAPIKEMPTVLVPVSNAVQESISNVQTNPVQENTSSQTIQSSNTNDSQTKSTDSSFSFIEFFKQHTGIVLLIGFTAFVLGVIYSKNKS